jgi:hypothetical protein
LPYFILQEYAIGEDIGRGKPANRDDYLDINAYVRTAILTTWPAKYAED